MIETIVVGYDGSDVSEQALARTAEVAAAFDSRVVVVVVDDAPLAVSGAIGMAEAPLVPIPDDHDALRDARVRQARSFMDGLGTPCEVVSPIGTADAGILQVADERAADLIVVGTNEPGFLERIFVGSVSGTVARTAGCDVLVVHRNKREP